MKTTYYDTTTISRQF